MIKKYFVQANACTIQNNRLSNANAIPIGLKFIKAQKCDLKKTEIFELKVCHLPFVLLSSILEFELILLTVF